MSKRHQSTRRRSYGRRQHELHERPDGRLDPLGWLDEPDLEDSGHRWDGTQPRDADAGWLRLRAVG